MIQLNRLEPSEAERIAYAEGFTGVADLFARIDQLEHALGRMVNEFKHYVEGDPSDEEVEAFDIARRTLKGDL